MSKFRAFFIILAGLFLYTASAQAQSANALTRIAGDVYHYHHEAYYSLVTITSEGVVVVDPINSTAVGRLKRILKEMTDQPVTHLIYSHSHSDHASGGIYFRAKNIIAHANAPKAIDGVKPTERFDETKTMTVGGKTFEMTWLGEGHAKDSIAVVVRPENIAFVVDIASPKRLPWRDFPGDDIDGRMEQIRKIQSLDFDILAPGHGSVGVKADVGDVLTYIETLRAKVLSGLEAGKSFDELRASITMEDYKDWASYASVQLNVQGMARYLATKYDLR